MRDRDEWDDEEPEDEDEGGEDEIALSAVQGWLDIEDDPSGPSELAQARGEALVAIAEAALALKEQREERQRQEAFSRKLAQREQRRQEERAELARQRREAWEKEQARRQREEELRVAREQEAERQRREAERKAADSADALHRAGRLSVMEVRRV